jgi:hypothetical protein
LGGALIDAEAEGAGALDTAAAGAELGALETAAEAARGAAEGAAALDVAVASERDVRAGSPPFPMVNVATAITPPMTAAIANQRSGLPRFVPGMSPGP